MQGAITTTRVVPATPEWQAPVNAGRPREAAPREERPAPLPLEPTYYGLREIDVYPQPAAPLRLPQAETDGDAGLPYTVRMEVFIDAQGVVTDVALRASSDPSRQPAVARQVIFATRFHPARRSGYAVASRIEIELRYGSGKPTSD